MRLTVFVALMLGVVSSPALAAGKHRHSSEWGFSVDFPSNLPVCVNGSWQRAHGWGAPLAGTCAKPTTKRAITVIANGSDVEEDPTGCGAVEIQSGAKLGLSFEGRNSETCRQDHDEDGTILVTVITQVHVDGAQAAKPGEAAISYEAELTTTPAHLAADLLTFRRVLRTVRIERPPLGRVR